VRAGERVRVRGRRGPFARIETAGGLRAFVRHEGLSFVQQPLLEPHLRGVVQDLGDRIVLVTRRGEMTVRRAGRPGVVAPIPGYFDHLLKLVPGTEVTLLGGFDPSGRFVDAEALAARAALPLDVKVFPAPDAGPNTFTGGPDGRLTPGTLLRVRGFGSTGDSWVAIERLGGPSDAYAFVLAQGGFGLDLGWPEQ
jgi:hypothetical protein